MFLKNKKSIIHCKNLFRTKEHGAEFIVKTCVFEKSANPSPPKSQSRVVDRTMHRFGIRPVSFVSDRNPGFGATFFRSSHVIFACRFSKLALHFPT